MTEGQCAKRAMPEWKWRPWTTNFVHRVQRSMCVNLSKTAWIHIKPSVSWSGSYVPWNHWIFYVKKFNSKFYFLLPREVNNNILFYLKQFANKLFLFVSAEKSDDLDQSKVERVLVLIGKLATNSNPTF